MCTAQRYPNPLPFFPFPAPKQVACISNNFEEEMFASHKQRHIHNQEQLRMPRKKNISVCSFFLMCQAISTNKAEYPFYLQQLPKVLEICEAPSLFLKTLFLLPFPKPCLQGNRAKGLGFELPAKENNSTWFKRTLCTYWHVSLYQQQLMFMLATISHR